MAGFKGSRCQFFDGTVALGVVSLAALLRCFTVRDLVRTIFGVLITSLCAVFLRDSNPECSDLSRPTPHLSLGKSAIHRLLPRHDTASSSERSLPA